MKKKRPYSKPEITTHDIDNTISLVMASIPEDPNKPFGIAKEGATGDPANGMFEGTQDDVFGGDKPSY